MRHHVSMAYVHINLLLINVTDFFGNLLGCYIVHFLRDLCSVRLIIIPFHINADGIGGTNE